MRNHTQETPKTQGVNTVRSLFTLLTPGKQLVNIRKELEACND